VSLPAGKDRFVPSSAVPFCGRPEKQGMSKKTVSSGVERGRRNVLIRACEGIKGTSFIPAANRAQFYLDVPSGPFYGFNRPGPPSARA